MKRFGSDASVGGKEKLKFEKNSEKWCHDETEGHESGAEKLRLNRLPRFSCRARSEKEREMTG